MVIAFQKFVNIFSVLYFGAIGIGRSHICFPEIYLSNLSEE